MKRGKPGFLIMPDVRPDGQLLWTVRAKDGTLLAAIDAEDGTCFTSAEMPECEWLEAIIKTLARGASRSVRTSVPPEK